jgi:hypothetical protein
MEGQFLAAQSWIDSKKILRMQRARRWRSQAQELLGSFFSEKE